MSEMGALTIPANKMTFSPVASKKGAIRFGSRIELGARSAALRIMPGRFFYGRAQWEAQACRVLVHGLPTRCRPATSLEANGRVPLTGNHAMTNLVTAREAAREIPPITTYDLTDWNDGETRIHDLRLAEALGFERPRKIREIIERNIAEIETLGPAPRRGALLSRPQGGTVEVTEYHLNEPQALLICMFSRTARAAEVRKQVIEVFMAWRLGKTPQKPPLAEYVPLLTLAQQIQLSTLAAKHHSICDGPEQDAVLEHVFLALRTAENTRRMRLDVPAGDEVTLR